MKKLFFLIMFLTSTFAFSQVEENADIAELAFHRLERLVLLKKIDPSYQDKYLELEFGKLESTDPEAANYQALFKQTQVGENEVSTLKLEMNLAGKTITHVENFIADSNSAPIWPDKDPVTLSENSLHFVQEEEAKGNLLTRPFFQGLIHMIIDQVEDEGVLKARVIMTSSKVTEKLHVFLNLDGTFSRFLIL